MEKPYNKNTDMISEPSRTTKLHELNLHLLGENYFGEAYHLLSPESIIIEEQWKTLESIQKEEKIKVIRFRF